jgi:hypothetical protein
LRCSFKQKKEGNIMSNSLRNPLSLGSRLPLAEWSARA